MTLTKTAPYIEAGRRVRRDAWIPNCWIQRVSEYGNIDLRIADENGKVFSKSAWSPKLEDIPATDYRVLED
jgi:hypothetical protein